MSITIKTEKDIEVLREGGKKLAHVMTHVLSFVAPGISAEELNHIAEEELRRQGGVSWFKGYRDYPSSICVSVNDEIVHGIPSKEKILRTGDIVSIDIGMKYKNRYTDMARTIYIGRVDKKIQTFIAIAKEALDAGIAEIHDGAHLHDVSGAIEVVIRKRKYGIVKTFVGHGVGYEAHEEPQIPNFVSPDFPNMTLKAGMVLAIEPMITEKRENVVTSADGWTIRTKDGSRAAHFEDTVVVTKNGAEVLTRV